MRTNETSPAKTPSWTAFSPGQWTPNSHQMKTQTKKKPSPALDEFAYHEVMDRAWLIEDTFETMLAEHPLVARTPQLRQLCAKIGHDLAYLYSLAGLLRFETFPDSVQAIKKRKP